VTDLITVLLGSHAQDLVDACRRGDLAWADRLTRLRCHADDATAAPVQISPATAWLNVRRFTEAEPDAEEETTSGLAALFSAVHRLGEPFAIEVVSTDGRLSTRLGLASPATRTTAARLLAPDLVLDVLDNLSQLPPVEATAVRLYVVPQERHTGKVELALLERLASNARGEWVVSVNCNPITAAGLEATIEWIADLQQVLAPHISRTVAQTEIATAQVVDPRGAGVERTLAILADELARMRAGGGWAVAIEVRSADPTLRAAVAAHAVAGMVTSEDDDRSWMGHTLPVGGIGGQPGYSLLSSATIAGWLRPPRAGRGSSPVGAQLPGSRLELASPRPLDLGFWIGTDLPATIDLADLEGHAFVAGTTGSGKTNTLQRLIVTAWNAHGVPFLVIDPVKSDYQGLTGVVREGLTVVDARELRFNALEPWAGFDVDTHLSYVAAAFKGSFSMPSPVPYVTTLLFDALTERMWTRDTYPTLHDLRRSLPDTMETLGYRGELAANITASLGTRLSILCAPRRAERLCASDSSMLVDLLSRPTVVSLAGIGDDEERAFLMAMLTLYVAEAARVRGECNGVAHLTVIEEAHRLVGEPTQGVSEDAGDAAGHAAGLVTQLLAEVRSAGECIVIVDQSPSAVARDVVRNTNLKIIHRLLDPADRHLCAGAIGLDPEESTFIAQLERGEAAVSCARMLAPQIARVSIAPKSRIEREAVALPASAARACCGSDHAAHHRAERHSRAASRLVVAALTRAVCVGEASAGDLWTGLEQLAARAEGVSAQCLFELGVTGAALAWAPLAAAAAADVRTALGAVRQRGAKLARAGVPALATPSARPFRECRGCKHSCVVRPLARLANELPAARDQLAALSHRSLPAARADWSMTLVEAYEDRIGSAAADDLARCVVAHALNPARAGMGD
jgi:hypothetical protein